jgi:hypothetical protein
MVEAGDDGDCCAGGKPRGGSTADGPPPGKGPAEGMPAARGSAMTSTAGNGRRGNFLLALMRFSVRRPGLVLGVAAILALVSVAYTVVSIDFKTSRNDLVAKEERVVRLFSEISEQFGRQTNVIVVVEGLDLERMKTFMRDLAARLESEPQYFDHLFYRLDTTPLETKKLLYLSTAEISDLKHKLEEYGELIEELSFTPHVNQIFSYINQKVSEATVTHLVSNLLGSGDGKSAGGGGDGAVSDAMPQGEGKEPVDLSFLRALLTETRLALGPEYRFHSPWDTFLASTSQFSQDGFLVSDDHRFAFMVLNTRDAEGAGFARKRASLERLRAHVRELLHHYGDLQAGVTGGSALATDEMSQALVDMASTSVVAVIGVGLLFAVFFRQIYNPILILVSLTVSICWTYGWLTLTVGHLTILSAAFASILIGLGDDYSTYILARYLEERQRGEDFQGAMECSYATSGASIVTGGITTALAFFAIMLADFQGIRELGFIAGSGIVLQMLATFTVLPAAMTLVERRTAVTGSRLYMRKAPALLGSLYRHPGTIVALAAVLTIAASTTVTHVSLDYNLLNLQAKGTESVEWEKKLTEHSKRSSWFAVTTAASLDEVRRKEASFKGLPSVHKVDSIADLLPEDQESRMQALRQLEPVIRGHDFVFQQPEPLDSAELLTILEKIQFKLRTDVKWDPEKKPADAEIAATREALVALLETLRGLEPAAVDRQLAPFQYKLFQDFAEKFALLRGNTDPAGPIRLEDVPEDLRRRFVSDGGRFLLQVFARDNIWEKGNMTRFVAELRSADPDVTGPPVIGLLAIDLMKRGYLQAAVYALLIDLVVIFVAFRNLKHTLLALVPLVVTTVWTFGWMGAVGMHLNLANLIAFPLVFGIVEDCGIHLVHRHREAPDLEQHLVSGSTAQAITLTSLTTMIGFGSLLVARHYGIHSLGFLMALTIGVAWMLSLVLLPVILKYVKR